MNKPTHQQLINEELKSEYREVNHLWRHGCYIWEVFYRKDDDTYWAVNYRLSTDGETNELREELCDIIRVKPEECRKVIYVSI